MQTIYIDVLFLLNFTVNYILLFITGRFFGAKQSFMRLTAASTIGAVGSFAILLPSLPVYITLIFNFTLCAVMVLCGYGISKHTKTRFIRLYLAFIGLSCALAGILFAVYQLLNPQGMVMANGAVYIDISPSVLIGACAAFYIICAVVRRLFRGSDQNVTTVTLDVHFGDESASIAAFVDTGHTLRDMFDDLPVIIATQSKLKCLIPDYAEDFFVCKNALPPTHNTGKFRLIPYCSLGNQGILPAFIPDAVYFRENGEYFKTQRCVIALTPQLLSDGYDALISPELLSEKINADNIQSEPSEKYRIRSRKN